MGGIGLPKGMSRDAAYVQGLADAASAAAKTAAEEGAKHRLRAMPNAGRRYRECACGNWIGTSGEMAGFRDHVVDSIVAAIQP